MIAIVHRGFLSSWFDRDASKKEKKKGEIERPRLRVINQKSIFIPPPLSPFRESHSKGKMTREDARNSNNQYDRSLRR